MKIFGYGKLTEADGKLLEMSEVTFQAEPAVLREIAAFLAKAADDMERPKSWFGRVHIQDEVVGWNECVPERPDVIVAS